MRGARSVFNQGKLESDFENIYWNRETLNSMLQCALYVPGGGTRRQYIGTSWDTTTMKKGAVTKSVFYSLASFHAMASRV